jgi:hypothetical protein
MLLIPGQIITPLIAFLNRVKRLADNWPYPPFFPTRNATMGKGFQGSTWIGPVNNLLFKGNEFRFPQGVRT